MNVATTITASMAGLNNGSRPDQGENKRLPNHRTEGWTPEQAREYNQLVQQQVEASGNTGDGASVGSLGSIRLQQGELAVDPYERPTSAPPPPGFVDPDSEDRNRRAEEAIFGVPLNSGSAHAHVQRPTALPSSESRGDEDANSGFTGDSDSAERGFSLTNLVDALGGSLTDSVEDSGQHTADSLLRRRLADNPNLQRQARHTASRLIGAPSSGTAVAASLGFGTLEHQGFRDPSRLFTAPQTAADSKHTLPNDPRGFPTYLSSPNRPPGGVRDDMALAQREANARGVAQHPSAPRGPLSYPHGKDIGVNVDEPTDSESQLSGNNISSGVVSKRIDPAAPSYNHGSPPFGAYPGGRPQSTLSSQSKEFRPGGHFNDSNDGASTLSDPLDGGGDVSPRQCEAELEPYLWEVSGGARSSRTIAITHASWLKPPEVRSECESFGALESFRAEFAPKGIFFASFYDIRSAEIAARELQGRLQRIVLNYGSSEDVLVRYGLPLNSSSQFDESQIVINGLSDEINEGALTNMLRSFGAIRACIYQGPGSYLIEFQNVQDAKQASLELESSLPWGPDTTVEVSPRQPGDRRRGRELLSTISRWRHGMGRSGPVNGGPGSIGSDGYRHAAPAYPPNDYRGGRDPGAGGPPQPQMMQHDTYYGGYGGGRQPETVTQLIMGPDGRYTPVVVQSTIGIPPHGTQYAVDPRGGQQQIIHGTDGHIYISSGPSQHVYGPGTQNGYPTPIVTGPAYVDGARRGGATTPYYSHSVASDNVSVHSGRSHGTHGTHLSHHSTGDDKDNSHLMLDFDAVENGRDTRTSLMVRNIPNKYTQQMLLAEFTENGHGPGVIDFFYLPIDFKNRCNRGYAFINFINFQDILAFHRRYYGKQWRTFNSDKICDITYARIQGKAAMLKRFENSALMDKDDEYKPLVFVSDGPEKGKRLPFADPTNKPI